MRCQLVRKCCFEKCKFGAEGAALIIVLFITTLVSILLVSLVAKQQIDFRRTANIINDDKSYNLAQGVVDWGVILLTRDLNGPEIDNLSEDWAYGLNPTALTEGSVSGTLEDMQGRFNINNLVAKNQDFRNHCHEQFARMLDMCDLDAGLLNSTIDWLDDDKQISEPGGAEDETYMLAKKPYRAANSIMTSPSELRLVAGIDSEAYTCLSPYISALPTDTFININTTSAFVLASISADFSLEDAEDFIDDRPENGFRSVSSFFQNKIIVETHFFGPFLTVSSDYFLAHVKTELDHATTNFYSLISRKDDTVQVVQQGINTY